MASFKNPALVALLHVPALETPACSKPDDDAAVPSKRWFSKLDCFVASHSDTVKNKIQAAEIFGVAAAMTSLEKSERPVLESSGSDAEIAHT